MSFFLLFLVYELKNSYLVSNAILFKILNFFWQFKDKLLPLPSQYLHAVGDEVTRFCRDFGKMPVLDDIVIRLNQVGPV